MSAVDIVRNCQELAAGIIEERDRLRARVKELERERVGITLRVSHDDCAECVFCYDAIDCQARSWRGLLGELAHLPDGTIRPPKEDGWSCPLLEGPAVVTSAGGSE